MRKGITPIMIIGAMKSGTTSLFSYLIQHPEICPGRKKELEYFSHKFGNKEFKKGKYEDLFDIDPSFHKFILDASTGYTKYPMEEGVPNRIKKYGLNPLFIYVVRNPIDRIISHYNFMKYELNWNLDIDSNYLINISKYHTQLKEFENVFPKERILVVDFDDLKKNPGLVCDKIFGFIGASEFNINLPKDSVKNKTENLNKNKQILLNFFQPFFKFSPHFLNLSIKRTLDYLFPDKKVILTKDQKERIIEELKFDMCNLSTYYSVNISKWGFGK
jgi:hypothetical protein